MPAIRINDESFNLCLDCWQNHSNQDIELLANLAYTTPDEVKRLMELEVDGGAHESYDNCNEVCAICDVPLTSDDDVGPELETNDQGEENIG